MFYIKRTTSAYNGKCALSLNPMNYLRDALEELKQLEDTIRRSGPVAAKGLWIDEYQPGGRSTVYARLRADTSLCPNGKRTQGLKRLGSDVHRDWQARIQRRDALEEIARRAQVIQDWAAKPIWRPSLTTHQWNHQQSLH